MKTRKTIVEAVCFVLMLNFFYEGIYKMAVWEQYGFWVTHQPLLRSFVGRILKFLVPILEISLAILLLIPSKRKLALWSILIAEVLFIVWIASVYLFTHYLFWPWKGLWEKPTWMQKMSYALLLCWLTFTMILLTEKQIRMNKSKQKLVKGEIMRNNLQS